MQRALAVLIALIASLEIALVYQRGFLLYSIAVILLTWRRVRGLVPTRAFIVSVGLGLLILMEMRPLVNLATSAPKEDSGPNTGILPALKVGLLYTANFDLLDVSVLTRSFVDHNGLLWGQSFIMDAARFLSPSIRNDLHLETITDKINIFYWGDVYLDSHIGLAVYLPHELYANFGMPGLFLGCIAGFAAASIDRWVSSVMIFTPKSIAFVYAALFVNGLMGEPGGEIQWGGAICLIGITIQRVSSILHGQLASRPAFLGSPLPPLQTARSASKNASD